MESRSTSCFEGINRVYRNAVVNQIRLRFKEVFPKTWLDELKSPFKQEEWERIQTHAELPRSTGELNSGLKDEFDILSVNHFYNIFDKYFDDIFMNISDNAEVKRRQKQKILGWTKTVKTLRDPVLGHPAEDDITFPDAFRMLDTAVRILGFINQDAAQKLQEIRDNINSDDKGMYNLILYRPIEGSTLPSKEWIVPRFVGRKRELDKLMKWFKDTESRVWLLAGDGGKGKTAIAYQFATNILNKPLGDLEIVIWMSAKARRFVSGRSVDIDSPDFDDLRSALDRVLEAYAAIELEEEMDINERKNTCLNYLKELPALVILDDIDSLEGKNIEAMNFFVRDANITPSKVLLTSRRVPFGFEPTVTQISGLEDSDSINFIKSRIELYDIDSSQFTNKIMKRIQRACDGSPLFIEDLLRLCKVGETPMRAIEIWRDRDGNAAREYALKREYDMFSITTQKVLLTCALFDSSVSLTDIAAVLNISTEEVRSSIRELQESFLVSKPHIIESIPRFDLNQNTKKLVVDINHGTDLSNRLKRIIKGITDRPQQTRSKRETIGRYIRQALSCIKLNRYYDAEQTLLKAINYHPENPDLYGMLGLVYKSWQPQQRYSDALNAFTRADDLKSSKQDMYWHWCQMELKRKEWTSATKIAKLGLDQVDFDSIPLLYASGYAHSRLAKDMFQQFQYGRAEQEAQTARLQLDKALKAFVKANNLKTRLVSFYRSTFRAIALNYELLIRINKAQQNFGLLPKHEDNLAKSLNNWLKECPNDIDALTERERLVYIFPNIKHNLDG